MGTPMIEVTVSNPRCLLEILLYVFFFTEDNGHTTVHCKILVLVCFYDGTDLLITCTGSQMSPHLGHTSSGSAVSLTDAADQQEGVGA